MADNYALQVQAAKNRFLTYDQEEILRKHRLEQDEEYIYVTFLCKLYRIHRRSGDLEWRKGALWHSGNSHGEVLTLFDLLCDSRADRRVSGTWKTLESFGLMFHQNLLQGSRDPLALAIDAQPEAFCNACIALGAQRAGGGDIAFTFPLFEDLALCLQFWHGDEDFAPRLRSLWDENALQYLRYETMHFALGLLRREIFQKMAPGEEIS